QLLPVSYPGSGVPDVFRNWPAVLQNKGWEFNFTARIVDEKDFSWSMGVNWTLPVNTLKSFPGLAQTQFAQILMVGQPLSVVQVRRFTGVDAAKGLFTFGDSMVGHFDATGFGGLHTELRYKRIGMLATVDARHAMGNNYLTTLYLTNPPGSTLYGLMSNAPAALTQRWEAPGQHAPYQQVTTDLNTPAGREIPLYTASSARLTNASFIRLKIIKLSYCVADNMLKHLHLSNLTLYIAGQDLLTFTPYKNVDPEIQNANILPPLRIIEAGLSVGI
ncbi:MAG TPA: hypothetical protein VGS79_29675, partial [Puia sp.]|nr:hypothetical protein [Puia sp.]